MRRRVEHVQHALGEAPAGVRDAAGHRQRAADRRARTGSSRPPCPALSWNLHSIAKARLRRLADAEHVDAAVLADDRLADADLAVDLQAARPKRLDDVAGDQVRVVRAASQRVESRSDRQQAGLDLAAGPAGACPSPNCRRRSAVSRTASGFRSVPRNGGPARSAATPTLPEPMNGSAPVPPAASSA